MDFDSDGNLVTVYTRSEDGFDLGVFRDGRWHHRTVPHGIEGDGLPQSVQMRIDHRDRIHLAIVWSSRRYNWLLTNLVYRRITDGEAEGSSAGLPSVASSRNRPTLELGPDGRPFIVVYDGGSIKIARPVTGQTEK